MALINFSFGLQLGRFSAAGHVKNVFFNKSSHANRLRQNSTPLVPASAPSRPNRRLYGRSCRGRRGSRQSCATCRNLSAMFDRDVVILRLIWQRDESQRSHASHPATRVIVADGPLGRPMIRRDHKASCRCCVRPYDAMCGERPDIPWRIPLPLGDLLTELPVGKFPRRPPVNESSPAAFNSTSVCSTDFLASQARCRISMAVNI